MELYYSRTASYSKICRIQNYEDKFDKSKLDVFIREKVWFNVPLILTPLTESR